MDRRVQVLIRIMRENMQEPPPLEEVAGSLNVSPSRLRSLFKGETGMSPAQYLKRLRMQRAKDLAESTFLNAKQIMNLLGISDQSHFARDFKRAHGMTLTECRARFNLATLPAVVGAAPPLAERPKNSNIGQMMSVFANDFHSPERVAYLALGTQTG